MSFDVLTIFTDEKDKNAERTMLSKAGGRDTIRTVINDFPDRTEMLRTKGGFPELTVTEKLRAVSQPAPVISGWVETNFNKRSYGPPVLTRLDPEMVGFFALVKPIETINFNGEIEGNFDFKPYPRVEGVIP